MYAGRDPVLEGVGELQAIAALERGERPNRPHFRGDPAHLMRETTWKIVSDCWKGYDDRIVIGDLVTKLKELQSELMGERDEHETVV